MTRSIEVLVDNESWILPYARQVVDACVSRGLNARLIRDASELTEGWVAFFLGCTRIVPGEYLPRHELNLAVHESDLPAGKGFAPMAWQIIEGRNDIVVSLIEAAEEVDSGPIWLQETIQLEGHELNAEWRALQGRVTVDLCLEFVDRYEELSARQQSGNSSSYPRRRPADSELDVDRTIAEQFDLLRTVHNEEYPAFFDYRGKRYVLHIEKANDS